MAREYAIIMAGGVGARFWPKSRRDIPKQFLSFEDNEGSLLRGTLERVWKVVPPDRTIVVTSREHRELVQEHAPELPLRNILGEPIGRNTAPCIAWAARHISSFDNDAVLAVLPADHHVGHPDRYVKALREGFRAAATGQLVTLGIRPSHAETGFGYIEVGDLVGENVHRARRFVEKPNKVRAEQFVASGRFLWNSGMFFFSATAILSALDTFLPGVSGALASLVPNATGEYDPEHVDDAYDNMPAISIDHGVMEKADEVLVVPSEFGWSDLGSWLTAWELASKDGSNNAAPSEAVLIDTHDSFVSSRSGKVVALVGVKDLLVIDTDDALLIVRRDRAQSVREVVRILRDRDDDRH